MVGTFQFIGDSLTDPGGENGKYKQSILEPISKFFGWVASWRIFQPVSKFLGWIASWKVFQPISNFFKWVSSKLTFKLFLSKSPHDEFTDGRVWADHFINRLKEDALSSSYERMQDVCRSKNFAQGGATAATYPWWYFFKNPIGYVKSRFLGTTKEQASKLMRSGSVKKGDRVIYWAGPNDILTVGGYHGMRDVLRSIDGVKRTVMTLTTPLKKPYVDPINELIIINLPMPGGLPRFKDETQEKKNQINETATLFNKALKQLVLNYRNYTNDFKFCPIYQFEKKEDINLSLFDKNSIILIGTGKNRTIRFVKVKEHLKELSSENDKTDIKVEYVKELSSEGDKTDKTLEIKVKVDNDLKAILQANTINKILNQNQLHPIKQNVDNETLIEYYVNTWLSQAKLNCEIKIFDAKAVFDEILQHPEANGFTSGCAIYFYDGNKEINFESIKSNAILLKKVDGKEELEVLFFEKGKLLCDEKDEAKKVNLTFSKRFKELYIDLNNPKKEVLHTVVESETKHEGFHIELIADATKKFNEVYKEIFKAADINVSWLDAQKKGYAPNQATYDGLHPSGLNHIEFANKFYDFYEENYRKHGVDEASVNEAPSESLSPQNDSRLGMRSNEASAWLDLFGQRQPPPQLEARSKELPSSFRFREPPQLKEPLPIISNTSGERLRG